MVSAVEAEWYLQEESRYPHETFIRQMSRDCFIPDRGNHHYGRSFASCFLSYDHSNYYQHDTNHYYCHPLLCYITTSRWLCVMFYCIHYSIKSLVLCENMISVSHKVSLICCVNVGAIWVRRLSFVAVAGFWRSLVFHFLKMRYLSFCARAFRRVQEYLRKVTTCLDTAVSLSVLREQIGCHWNGCCEILGWRFSLNICLRNSDFFKIAQK